MKDFLLRRREFLVRAWKWLVGLAAAAGLWTSWDVLKPNLPAGFGGKVPSVPPDQVPSKGIIVVPEAHAYLTKVNGDVVALWWKCTHLGCRVPWCSTSSEFECPCHGSIFDRAGDYRAGPAPRGLDRFATSVQNGVVVIDTSKVVKGPPPGTKVIDEPPTGPRCIGGGGA